jgi:hypothetical protein
MVEECGQKVRLAKGRRSLSHYRQSNLPVHEGLGEWLWPSTRSEDLQRANKYGTQTDTIPGTGAPDLAR